MNLLIDNRRNNQTITETKVNLKHSGQLPTQSQQRKNQSKMRNKPKVNSQDTRTTYMTSLWSIHCKPKVHNTTCPSATTNDSEQANARINEKKHFAE